MKLPIALVVLFLSLSFVPPAQAQLLWRWFGPKAADKAAPAKSPLPDPRRVTEVEVEVAWLADTITFPYYLEAHATPTQLEVRGYVPDKAVRERAMRIAQVHSALPVVDAMKEHSSLMVRPGQMSTQQLQASVQSSLRVALPKQYQQLKVHVSGDGKVIVAGPVSSYEEKVAVSHALRRLHGCTSVQNLTALPTELVQTPSLNEPREKTPIVKTSNPHETKTDKATAGQDTKTRSWLWPFGKAPATTREEPPLLETPQPMVVAAKKPFGPLDPKERVPREPDVVPVELPTPPKTPALSAPELRKRVLAAVPTARGAEVQFGSTKEVRILLEIRDEKELSPAAERIFAMPELKDVRLDLQFKIGAP